MPSDMTTLCPNNSIKKQGTTFPLAIKYKNKRNKENNNKDKKMDLCSNRSQLRKSVATHLLVGGDV